MNTLVMTASSVLVSELKSNLKYLSVSMRMFSTRPNLNHCAVTEAFIDEIVNNKNDYVCMGLFADVSKLKKKDYRGLTHLYNRETDTFLADQVGSFYDFEKVNDEYGVSLIGYARVTKRSELVCNAIEELYANNMLNFSFEISAGKVEVVDGITVVDADEANELTGMAIVSVPAYPESKALELVAEVDDINRFYANALIMGSELDLETVKMNFHKSLWDVMHEKVFELRVLIFGLDSVVLYDESNGVTLRVEYMPDECGGIFIKDIYPIDFVRARGCEEMDDMKNVASVAEVEEPVIAESVEVVTEQAEVVEAEVEVAEEIEAKCKTRSEDVEEDVVEEEPEKKEEIPENKDEEMEAMKKKCSELEAQVAELLKVKAELDRIHEDTRKAEADAKREQMKAYASAEGLDVEDDTVSKAIAEMDYSALMAEVMANKSARAEAATTYAAGYTDMKIGGFDYLLQSR